MIRKRGTIAPLLAVFSVSTGLCVHGQQLDTPKSVWDGVYSTEQATRGESLYGQYCSSCHGTALEGGEMAPPLAGGAFNANWNGLSLGDLLERTRVSMPQNSPGSLTRPQYVDILAFMLRSGNFPEGQKDLARETEVLKQIAFVSSKP